MKNRWNDDDAAKCTTDLALRVYSSRLLGADPSLVLHGGGNTSVKIVETNVVGEEEEILYVKGSGWDLGTIAAEGFAPVRMSHLLKLAKLPALPDPLMVNELKTSMTNATAPGPSVETILHALLPYTFVDHSHADAAVSVTNTADGEAKIREIYGDEVVVIPYVMPGFDLARSCAELFVKERTDKTIGMLLMNHGVFSFGGTAKESYDRHIYLVQKAEDYLAAHDAFVVTHPSADVLPTIDRNAVAQLRADVSAAAGSPRLLALHRDDRSMAYVRRDDIGAIAQQGPATPDHVIRTKRLAQIGRDVDGYVASYKEYFATASTMAKEPKTMLEPSPKVILDTDWGVITAGKAAKETKVVFELYEHTIDIVLRGVAQGGYEALPAQDIFDVEYWDLEQAKLKKGGASPLFAGEVALVTGAASGIGAAAVESLLARGAAVVGLDLSDTVLSIHNRPDYCGVVCDVTDETALGEALDRAVQKFGGIDMLVLNAGIFTTSRNIADLPFNEWRRVFAVNLDANLSLLRMAAPLLKRAPNKGRVTIIGSKNVPAPGPGAASYSASKAALTQLARIAALEWGADGIRVNVINPDAVFDTAIWTDEVLATRAQSYGLTIEQYKTKNVLKAEVTSRHVAEMVAETLGPLFARTTGAQVPVDGGNDRVI